MGSPSLCWLLAVNLKTKGVHDRLNRCYGDLIG